MSKLAESIRQRILDDGPLSVADYMACALSDPQLGYYMTRDPFGRSGDFTTAPEVNQMFGELIGLWAVAAWQLLGAPSPWQLIELGPGRGTLMADALRAIQTVPSCAAAVNVHLIEISPVLQDRQREILKDHGQNHSILWHGQFTQVPDGPSVVIANEFFDALPIHQYERRSNGWCERLVALNQQGEFYFDFADSLDAGSKIPNHLQSSPVGSIFEIRPAADTLLAEFGERLKRHPGAGLIIDYGHTASGVGDTLQAVKNQQFCDIFFEPGEIDITAHVDFEALMRVAENEVLNIYGPVTQKRFLEQLGIAERAKKLQAHARPDQSQDIETALTRLIVENHMGDLFQALGFSAPNIETLPGFS